MLEWGSALFKRTKKLREGYSGIHTTNRQPSGYRDFQGYYTSTSFVNIFHHHELLVERLNCLDFEGVENLGDMGGRLSPAAPPLLSSYVDAPPPSPLSKPPPPVLLLKMLAAHSGNGDLGEVSGAGDRPGVEGTWIPKVAEAVETGGMPLWERRWCRGGLKAAGLQVGRWGCAGCTWGSAQKPRYP